MYAHIYKRYSGMCAAHACNCLLQFARGRTRYALVRHTHIHIQTSIVFAAILHLPAHAESLITSQARMHFAIFLPRLRRSCPLRSMAHSLAITISIEIASKETAGYGFLNA